MIPLTAASLQDLPVYFKGQTAREPGSRWCCFTVAMSGSISRGLIPRIGHASGAPGRIGLLLGAQGKVFADFRMIISAFFTV